MATEKERAAEGELYDVNDMELHEERVRCKKLYRRYNSLPPEEREERDVLLRRMLGQVGRDPIVESPFYCDYGYNIEAGDYFYANVNCVILDGARVRFGHHVFVGPGCGFYTATHPLDVETRNRGLEQALPITVGNDVWIGGGCTLLPGVTIGDGTVIGAGSVVTRDIPAGVVAVGNPCRVIKKLNNDER